jgi:hypothetical protein
MFLNISACALPDVWLSLFPRFSGGEHVPPLEALETLGVPRVPPFPRFFFTETFGRYGNQGEVTP